MLHITEDQFYEKFNPIENHIDTNASFDGCMFETYDEELDHVKAQPNNKVWTIVEGDDDTMFYLSGYHVVNRIGYLITEEEWEEETEVKLDTE